MGNESRPARGMRDFLPAELSHRAHLLHVLNDVARGRGFTAIQTPALERISSLKSDQGGENETMLFQVLRRGLDPTIPILPNEAVDLGLRYDLTLPLTRFFADQRPNLPLPFKVSQHGSVWRAERPQKGRYREFTQFDLDILGDPSVAAEVQLLSAGFVALDRLGLARNAKFEINDRRLLNDILGVAEVPAELRSASLVILDKLGKIGVDQVTQQLVDRLGLPHRSAYCIVALIEALQTADIDQADPNDGVAIDGHVFYLYDIPLIIRTLKRLHPLGTFHFTPALVRGMGYYTGPIYEVIHDQSSSSICGGGRYDSMVRQWGSRDTTAVGFSFGFERIADLLPDAKLDTSSGEHTALLYRSPELIERTLKLREEILAREPDHVVSVQEAPARLKANYFDGLRLGGVRQYVDMDIYPEATASTFQSLARPLK